MHLSSAARKKCLRKVRGGFETRPTFCHCEEHSDAAISITMRAREVTARRAHNPKAIGSNRTPATIEMHRSNLALNQPPGPHSWGKFKNRGHPCATPAERTLLHLSRTPPRLCSFPLFNQRGGQGEFVTRHSGEGRNPRLIFPFQAVSLRLCARAAPA